MFFPMIGTTCNAQLIVQKEPPSWDDPSKSPRLLVQVRHNSGVRGMSLTYDQVTILHDTLGEWLKSNKPAPVEHPVLACGTL